VYVPCERDARLEQIVREAGAGSNRIAVLVGGSWAGVPIGCL
jgi:hypothetical protein